MFHLSTVLGLLASAAVVAAAPAAAPVPTAGPDLNKRATTCTFTDAASASKSKTSCSTIILSAIAVPSGTTLDLTDLEDDTHVSLPVPSFYTVSCLANHFDAGHLRGYHHLRLRRMVRSLGLSERNFYHRHRFRWRLLCRRWGEVVGW